MDDRQLLRRLWRGNDLYFPLMEIIASRSAVVWLKATVGTVAWAVSVIALSISLFDRNTGIGGHVGAAVGAAAAALWGLRWLTRPMPDESQAVALFAVADVLTAALCVPIGGVFVTWAGVLLLFAIGIYFGLFHNAKVLAAHVVWSVVFAMVLTAGLARQGKPLAVVVSFLVLVLVANCVLLPGLHFVCGVLWTELLSDPLTGLWDRRGLRTRGRAIVEQAGRLPVCVLVIDLDRFKKVNDTFGHHIGDDVLVRTADRLRATVPSHAVIARTGGEEFAVVVRLPIVEAYAVAERLRRAIAETADPVAVTASIGVAAIGIDEARRHGSDHIAATLACRADAAMYRAKLNGGDNVALDDITAGLMLRIPEWRRPARSATHTQISLSP
ncbi:GGDEF domain-containing protein [Nocardia sp. CDC159]|uniref:GGDEF domain-containing protein n=1 Tax=Nocardia pulmonis TaxID=2951408 RepID=A0A9X2E2M5_9NOCA|nr:MULTISPECIES: GGDEF domain-containing protein [Nocardia]MCM6772521.1 GGDEF domain-containing protein [Nocardia pulmonis]MCM6784821.1 GGDEF domain-containing protein [Nocardia sp. CDC159]